MRVHLVAAIGAALILAGCATGSRDRDDVVEPGVGDTSQASAELRRPGGLSIGATTIAQAGDSLRVRIDARGLAPGVYGAHIHTTGRCDSPDFASAGPHWNPTDRQHGRNNPEGQHRGDLPNLMVGTNGQGELEFTIPGTWLNRGGMPLLDRDGASIIIHERPDDYRTDPSGNSGARIACGVLA